MGIYWHEHLKRQDREKVMGQKGLIVWFTGLSGSGKSTIAKGVDLKLLGMAKKSYVLDGDNLRHALNADLGFDSESRIENIRRAAEVSAILMDAGLIVLAAFISPFKSQRDSLKVRFKERFVEVYVKCALETCKKRDPKKLYEKAKLGEITNLTGVGSEYEEPIEPNLVIESERESVEQSVERVTDYLTKNLYVNKFDHHQ